MEGRRGGREVSKYICSYKRGNKILGTFLLSLEKTVFCTQYGADYKEPRGLENSHYFFSIHYALSHEESSFAGSWVSAITSIHREKDVIQNIGSGKLVAYVFLVITFLYCCLHRTFFFFQDLGLKNSISR